MEKIPGISGIDDVLAPIPSFAPEPAAEAALPEAPAFVPMDRPSAQEDDRLASEHGWRLVGSAFFCVPLWGLAATGSAQVGGIVPWLGFGLAGGALACGWPLLAASARLLARGQWEAPEALSGVACAASFALAAGGAIARGQGYADAAALIPGFECPAAIAALSLFARWLEARALGLALGPLRQPGAGLPDRAHKVRSGAIHSEEDIPLARVLPGDQLRVRPGERVPADGRLLLGRSRIDEQAVTGEMAPQTREARSPLLAGTQNGSGSFLMEAEQVGDATLARRIGRQARAGAPAPTEKRLIRAASAMGLAALFAPLLTCLAWRALWAGAGLAPALASALSTLICLAPAALLAASRLPIQVARGRAARIGVLARDASALEGLGRIDTLIFDKSGTLTEGRPQVDQLIALGGLDEEELLASAAAIESGCEHPIARAIVKAAERRGLVPTRGLEPPGDALHVPGQGVSGRLASGARVAVGNQKLMESQGVFLGVALLNQADLLRLDQGQSAIFVAIDGRPVGLLGIADPLRPGAALAVRQLQGSGLRVVLMTGDHPSSAHALSRRLGIGQFEAEVPGERKTAVARELERRGRAVAVVSETTELPWGALTIAMGEAKARTFEGAGITLIRNDLGSLARARDLSLGMMRTLRQGACQAGLASLALGALAAGALYPLTGFVFSPVLAAAASSLLLLAVILRALRLRG